MPDPTNASTEDIQKELQSRENQVNEALAAGLQDKFSEAKDALANIKNEMTSIGTELLKAQFKVFFVRHPNLQEFSWTQYTPYFNDGDVCEFSSQHNYGDYEFIESQESYRVDEIDEFMKQFTSPEMELMFGDHAKVSITRESIEIDEYEHE